MPSPPVLDRLRGIDVSEFQRPADWDPTGLAFLIARATIGTRPDTRYSQHIDKARRAGIKTGAYCFPFGSLTVATQVDAFLAAAGEVDMYAVDVEGKDPLSTAQIRAFIARVKSRGKRCGLYMSEAFFVDAGQDWDWVANWTNEPRRHWDLWQFGPFHQEDGDLARDALTLATITGDTMAIYAQRAQPGTFGIPKGREVHVLTPVESGWKTEKTYTPTGDYQSRYDARLSRLAGTTLPSTLIHVSEGGLKGFYLATAEVEDVDDPPVPEDCTAEIAADRAKAHIVWG